MGCGSSNVRHVHHNSAPSVDTEVHRYNFAAKADDVCTEAPTKVMTTKRPCVTNTPMQAPTTIEDKASSNPSNRWTNDFLRELYEELDAFGPREHQGFDTYEPETPTWWVAAAEQKALLNAYCSKTAQILNGIGSISQTSSNVKHAGQILMGAPPPSPEVVARVESWISSLDRAENE